MKLLTRNNPAGLLLLAIILLLPGCDSQDSITRQRAPKPEPLQAVQRRTLGAIVLRDDKAWFFKVTGLDERVQKHEPEFREFVQQVSFDSGGRPRWDLPSGWREVPGGQFRFRTLLMSSDTSPLELAVSSLPLAQDDQQKYLLENINRWRNQLDLAPVSPDQLAQQMDEAQLAGEETAYFVNLTGTGSGAMGGSAMGSGGMTGAPAAEGAGPAEPDSGTPQLEYETPEGWQPARVGGMRLAAFAVQDGDQQAEVTVIPLGLGAADLLDNINRWRGQIGLPPLAAGELDQHTRSLEISGAAGTYVVLEGPAEASPRQSILGVILPRENRVWFIKMTGDAALVAREQPRFEQFAQSLRLP